MGFYSRTLNVFECRVSLSSSLSYNRSCEGKIKSVRVSGDHYRRRSDGGKGQMWEDSIHLSETLIPAAPPTARSKENWNEVRGWVTVFHESKVILCISHAPLAQRMVSNVSYKVRHTEDELKDVCVAQIFIFVTYSNDKSIDMEICQEKSAKV